MSSIPSSSSTTTSTTTTTGPSLPLPVPILLGSSSSIRRHLCHQLFDPTPIRYDSPNIDEKNLGDPVRHQAHLLTQTLAHAKADALIKKYKHENVESLLITSDQVAVYVNEIREKPKDQEECRRFLKSYALAPVQTVSTVVVTNTQTGDRVEGHATASQWFLDIPEPVLDQLIQTQPLLLHCAGGFCMEEPLLQPYLGPRVGTLDTLQGFPCALVKSLVETLLEKRISKSSTPTS